MRARARVGIGVVAALGLLAAAEAASSSTARLGVGKTAFWDDKTKVAAVSGLPDCSDCLDRALPIAGGAARLRVAVDSSVDDASSIELFDPSRKKVSSDSAVYSAEVYALKPKAGTWYVRVHRDAGTRVRMRAKLERTIPSTPRQHRMLLPNLQLIPPYEFTFDEPIGQGVPGTGCKAYEIEEYKASKCLRFSLGPRNVGEGPFMLSFPAASGFLTPAPVYQRLLFADGTTVSRQAGTALFHKTHAHHHHNGFGKLELLRVTDASRGRLAAAGGGPKQGFCMLDYVIADWTAFRNAAAGETRQDCTVETHLDSTELGLGVGWGDIYVWSLDGNYVDFNDKPDGRYVVRSIADASNDVLESDETDNAGYAYLAIKGNTITVLERGQGTSPWDPRKKVARDMFRPTVAGGLASVIPPGVPVPSH